MVSHGELYGLGGQSASERATIESIEACFSKRKPGHVNAECNSTSCRPDFFTSTDSQTVQCLGVLHKTIHRDSWPHARRFNDQGYENADICAWTFSSNTFAAGGGLANVRWNCPAAAVKQGCTSRYYLIQVTALNTNTSRVCIFGVFT